MTTSPGGTITIANDFTISRMGFGAMQLAGPGVFGPPADRGQAIAVLHEAVELGITHIDTSDFYGPVVTNLIIKEALHPYADELHLFTKVGARRGADGSWNMSREPEDLKAQVRENLEHLELDALDVVYLRMGEVDSTNDESLAEQFGALAELQTEGLIRHLALSSVSDAQLTEALTIAPVVSVQNLYNLVARQDDAIVERCARENIAFASYFPLGGFSPLQSDTLTEVATSLGASAQQVALAWLLQRSATSCVIPGTSSVAHLRENVAAVDLVLPAAAIAQLDAIGQLDAAAA
jgi:aryl-alcohol dehydrogenase-like predicted oxidoreductase